jgi:23S rRNA pseudouridine1911/1915/1917 synthase
VREKLERLDRRLRAMSADVSWTRVREAIERGQVMVDGEVVRDPGAPVAAGAVIDFDPSRKRQPHARLDLPRLYEDADVLVIDKPAGLLSMATAAESRHYEDTVLARAITYAGHLHGRQGYAGLLHRLDRDTSGALALALSREAHARGRELFAAHAFERHYLAIVRGVPEQDEGTIEAAVSNVYASGKRRLARFNESGREAVTHYAVRERFDEAALIELELDTGRQHQIRLHMQSLGHPLIGDEVYGSRGPAREDLTRADGDGVGRASRASGVSGARRASGAGRATPMRQMLHAWRLAFPNPMTGETIRVEAPLPRDFEKVLRALRARGRAAR